MYELFEWFNELHVGIGLLILAGVESFALCVVYLILTVVDRNRKEASRPTW